MLVHDSVNGMVTCADVAGLEQSIVASGFPMKNIVDRDEFEQSCATVYDDIGDTSVNADYAHDTERAIKLAGWGPGEGHHCYLCGIVVQCNITAPRYWWPEMQRYHFVDIVSSTSTMHKLRAFIGTAHALQNIGDMAGLQRLIHMHFSDRTREDSILKFLEAAVGNFDDIAMLKANLPEGWLQTARITTNYRALKTIVHQRNNHPLPEWREFCEWCKTLPMSELIYPKAD